MLFHLNQGVNIDRRKSDHPEQGGDQPVDQERFKSGNDKQRKIVNVGHERNLDHQRADDQDREHVLKHKCDNIPDIFGKVYPENVDRLHHIRGYRAFYDAVFYPSFNIGDKQHRQEGRHDDIRQHAVRIHIADNALSLYTAPSRNRQM